MEDRWQWIRDLFVRDWSLKALAVLLGALSFYVIRGAVSFEVPYNIPLEIRVEPGIAILDQSLKTVDVTFRGSQENLRHLDQKQIKVVVQPKARGIAGSETVPIVPENVKGMSGVRVVSVRPSEVTLTFDHEVQKEVAVLKPKAIGRPLMGRARIEYEPHTVMLHGPQRRLETISALSTEPVDVDGRVESFTRKVRVLSPGDAWVAQIDPPEVSVSVAIMHESAAVLLTNVAVLAAMPPGSREEVRVEPAAVSVSLEGSPDALDDVAKEAVQVVVSCGGLEPGRSYELPVRAQLPPDLELQAEVDPPMVKVTVKGKR
jgi:YbbR domain-containing protein